MTDADGRVPAEIPNNVDEDVPPESDGPTANGSDPGALTEVDDPEAEHKRNVDRSKLRFAIWFTSLAAIAVVALGVLEYITPELAQASGGRLDGVSDALKLLTTTSLGYIFGRSAKSGDG